MNSQTNRNRPTQSFVFPVRMPGHGDFEIDLFDLLDNEPACLALSLDTFLINTRAWLVDRNGKELFQPMRLSDYLRWLVNNIAKLSSGGDFLISTYDCDVILSISDTVRIRCVKLDFMIDRDLQCSGEMSGEEEGGVYWTLNPLGEFSDGQVARDLTIPLHQWAQESIHMAERFLQVAKKCLTIRELRGLEDDDECRNCRMNCSAYACNLESARQFVNRLA